MHQSMHFFIKNWWEVVSIQSKQVWMSYPENTWFLAIFDHFLGLNGKGAPLPLRIWTSSMKNRIPRILLPMGWKPDPIETDHKYPELNE